MKNIDVWSDSDIKRWDELCGKTPDELTSAEVVEAQAMAERAVRLLEAGVPLPNVVVFEVVDGEL